MGIDFTLNSGLWAGKQITKVFGYEGMLVVARLYDLTPRNGTRKHKEYNIVEELANIVGWLLVVENEPPTLASTLAKDEIVEVSRTNVNVLEQGTSEGEEKGEGAEEEEGEEEEEGDFDSNEEIDESIEQSLHIHNSDLDSRSRIILC
ncbi:hypothetical protein PIB30_058681 [Stylosanthes scabra]|uniref:Uncharacterized protein n=1 Tax=Stylosanthes scabra TaxID=79078 RepID=A0ABU6TJS6_9FABA|nr:hypothetical protein [Stylosanthes scabra]